MSAAGALADAVDRIRQGDVLDVRVVDAIAELDIGVEARDRQILQRDIVGRDGDAVTRRGAVACRGGEEGGGRAGDRVVGTERAGDDHAIGGAGKREAGFVDRDVLVIGAGSDDDRVARIGRIDRRLDGREITTGRDQQDVMIREMNATDAGDRVGAVGRTHPVIGEGRRRAVEGAGVIVLVAGVVGNVETGGALNRVVACTAGQRVVAANAFEVSLPPAPLRLSS